MTLLLMCRFDMGTQPANVHLGTALWAIAEGETATGAFDEGGRDEDAKAGTARSGL